MYDNSHVIELVAGGDKVSTNPVNEDPCWMNLQQILTKAELQRE